MNRKHLSIVPDSAAGVAVAPPPAPRRITAESDGQLKLDLKGGEIRRILIVSMDTVHGTRLAALLEELQAATVVDLRHAIRFDLPGLNRVRFFDALSRSQTAYTRAPLDWQSQNLNPFAGTHCLPTRLHHEAVERWDGHLLLLVSKPEHARGIHSLLNGALSATRPDGWGIEQVA